LSWAFELRTPLALIKAICTRTGNSMRTQAFSRRIALGAVGVTFALLAWPAFVPTSALAGCSHLVTSRDTQSGAYVPSVMIGTAFDGQPGKADPRGPYSNSQTPGACQGAWCGEHPLAPVAPAATLSGHPELWAWCVKGPIAAASSSYRLRDQEVPFHALHRSAVILRPPRRSSFV
jgi:hypothetical protein